MATLARKDRGAWLIQFFDQNKKRRPIHLGKKFNEKTAQALKDVVEKIVYSRDNSTNLDKKTLAWIQEAPVEIQDKLAAVGLITKPEAHTAKELWDEFMRTKTDIKDSTMETYDRSRNRFFAFFKGEEQIADLIPARMRQWKEFLKTDIPQGRSEIVGFKESTVAGTLTKAKAVFNWAVRSGWLTASPLDGIGRGSFINRENDYFVTMEDYQRLLDACPCADWRAILALSRVGGLRAPSEILRLKWSDINWEMDRFYVTSSKTERHKGKEGRVVPLFPDLRSELEELFFLPSSEGAEYVVNRYRNPGQNLGTQFARIEQMAGLEKIPKPFNNMRASRSTEVYAEFGAFLESKWIGHSHKIARDHYLQVREEDFLRAVGKPVSNSGGMDNHQPDSRHSDDPTGESPKKVATAPNSLHDFSETLQDSLQQGVANARNGSQTSKKKASQTF